MWRKEIVETGSRKFKEKVWNVIFLGIGLIFYVLLVSILGIGCPFRFVFHIPCPVCGLTRAVRSIVRGEFSQAFSYHPLVLLIPVWLVVLFGRDTRIATTIGKKKVWAFLYLGAAVIFLVYLYRLVFGLII